MLTNKRNDESQSTGDVRAFNAAIFAPLVIIIFIGFTLWSTVYASEDNRFEVNARLSLRSIGSSMLAYQASNDAKYIGSYYAMLDSGYIQEGDTLETMIEHYSLSWEVANTHDLVGYTFISERMMNRFTIIAWPDKPHSLRTYCITEDQVVRVFDPYSYYELEDIYSWRPVL